MLISNADCSGVVNCGTSGFQALLAGHHDYFDLFESRGENTLFWSSTESSSLAWARGLLSDVAHVRRDIGGKANGISVRCVKD